MLLQYAFEDYEEDILTRTKADGKLLNLASLRTRTKVWQVLIRHVLLADNAGLMSHTEAAQQLIELERKVPLQKLANRLIHHTAILKRNLDHIGQPGEAAAEFPPTLPQTSRSDQVAGQSNEYREHAGIPCFLAVQTSARNGSGDKASYTA
ncbi:hypothetical protein ElyMa_007031800 [Elysia marginata]|uniref:Uncharacterized protein n=1 Tax=Elysia marginata TaxID=1093978 RepID=A0AAV4JYI7_9GAST|nr:hypothetical protein ElyMa_007031800 [Elysia marginata]